MAFIVSTLVASTIPSFASPAPSQGDWVRYKVMRAHEHVPTAIDYVTISVGPKDDVTGATWWQMTLQREKNGIEPEPKSEKKQQASPEKQAKQAQRRQFVVRVLSDRAPMTSENGDIGKVYRYIFKQGQSPALEYVDKYSGLAYLPQFGFRDGLVPTPRSTKSIAGKFLGTGSIIGQPITACSGGSSSEWTEIGEVKRLVMDGDLTVGSSRWTRDDGTGPGADGEYRYVELTAEDYDRLIEAGFNKFIVNQKHLAFIRDREVFFIKRDFTGDSYPEMLYRSNYAGPTIYTDEPASRLDAKECRTIYDAVNLLRTRNRTYYYEPGANIDAVVKMIQTAGYSAGDWYPKQTAVPVGETYYETACYQVMGGAGAFWHEGRYTRDTSNPMLQSMFGADFEMTPFETLDSIYGYLRGAARCFNVDWGMSIYGQADFSIADDCVSRAYDKGAHHVHLWTSDHDHHVAFTKQLEIAKAIRGYQKSHPRTDRHELNKKAKVALAVPEGYINFGHMMWWSNRFNGYRLNEYGIPYQDVMAEVWWNIYKLAKSGVEYDCVVDYPEVVDKAGYERIIRVRPDGTSSDTSVNLPSQSPKVSAGKPEKLKEYQPDKNAPVVYAKAGSVKLDGDLSKWKDAKWVTLDKKIDYQDASPWGGADDLSARTAFSYDDDALHVAVDVRDDIQTSFFDADDIWKNDCIQIGIDPLSNPAETDGFYSHDDTEFGVSLVDGKPYVFVWEQRHSANGVSKEIDAKVVREGTKTFYEIRIPFSSVRPLTPGYPGRCRFNIVVGDSDEEGTRKGVCALSSGIADGKHPARWTTLVFEGSEKIKNPVFLAYLKLEKPMVKQGEDLVISLDAGTVKAADANVQVVVRSKDRSAPVSQAKVKLQSGMNEYPLIMETKSLGTGSYYADVTVTSAAKTAAKQSLKFFVR